MYRRAGRGRLLLFVFLALSVVIITLDFRENPGGPLKRAKDVAAAVVAPVQRGFSAITEPVGNFFSSIGELAGLRSENERLEAALDEAEADAEAVGDLSLDNIELREALALQKSWRSMNAVTAEVYSQVPSNYKWAVDINKGRSDGIKPNMAVIYTDGLVGKVIEAGSHSARVLLLIDPNGAAGARVEEAGSIGVIRGNGGSEYLSLGFVKTDAEVSVGDTVVTSGYDGGIFPPGIDIGTVVEVGGEEADLAKDIQVEPFVDFDSLARVVVLTETGDVLGRSEGKR